MTLVGALQVHRCAQSKYRRYEQGQFYGSICIEDIDDNVSWYGSTYFHHVLVVDGGMDHVTMRKVRILCIIYELILSVSSSGGAKFLIFNWMEKTD